MTISSRMSKESGVTHFMLKRLWRFIKCHMSMKKYCSTTTQSESIMLLTVSEGNVQNVFKGEKARAVILSRFTKVW